MGDTNIEWATKVWNPTRGCRRVSPGCEHCYAERQAIRHSGPGGPYEGLVALGKNGPRWTGEARLIPGKLDEPLRWRRRDGGRERVFVDSMSDLFYEGFSNEEIAAVFGAMAACPQNTKRPERARDWFRWVATDPLDGDGEVRLCLAAADQYIERQRHVKYPPWPLPNVWLGVSVEDQQRADERIPILLDVPAAIRFVSAEPLLGPVDLSRWMWPVCWEWSSRFKTPEESLAAGGFARKKRQALVSAHARFLDWCIIGGESGPGARPMELAWARALVEQCAAAGAACFMKQLGARPVTITGTTGRFRTREGRRQVELTADRLPLLDRKGGDPAEWPEDLRVRQFPNARLTAGCKDGLAGTEHGAIVPNPTHGTEI